jgi:hypothetical protein
MRSYNDALLPGERKKIEMRSHNNALPPEEKNTIRLMWLNIRKRKA